MAEQRILALDIFRGLTIMGMIIVNTPGSWEFVYPVLRHAVWNGCTPTDLVFPFFIFAMGFSAYLSISRRKSNGVSNQKILLSATRRSIIIFALGLIINTFPFTDLMNFRIPGVLQRIAIVNMFCVLFLLYFSDKRIKILIPGLLVSYWAVMRFIPVPGFGFANLEPSTNLAAWIDRLVFGKHVWIYTGLYDPEGVLSTIPAIASGLIGILAGKLFSKSSSSADKLNSLLLTGVLLIFAGLVWSLDFPLNKQLWTSSFVLYTSGLAMLVFGIIYWYVDVKGKNKFATPFVAFGCNPIVAYFGSEIGAILLGIIKVKTFEGEMSLYNWLFIHYQLTGLSPINASLLGALLFTGFWLVVVLIMYRNKIVVKI